MSLKKANTIRLIYGIFLSLFTVVIGFLFLTQVVSIYNSGPQKPFTREIVGEHLSAIAVPCIIWIVAVVAAFIVWAVLPQPKKKFFSPSPVAVLNALSPRIPDYADKCEKEYALINKRKTALITARVICGVIAAASVTVCVLYLFTLSNIARLNAQSFEHGVMGALATLFNVRNFDADPTKGVITMTAHLLPWIGTSIVCFAGLSLFEWITAKRLLPTVKTLVAEGAKQGFVPEAKQKKQVREHTAAVTVIRIGLAVLAVALIVIGAVNGGAYDVFIKAINICTECIGLG